MLKIVVTLLGILLFFSCKKEKTNVLYNDLSISTSIELNRMLQIDSLLFIVGGERYSQSKIIVLNIHNFTIKECLLPFQAEKKELYGIAKNELNELMAVGYGGTQYFSNDTGKTWYYKQHHSWEEFRAVSFSTKDSAILVGKKTEKEGYLFQTDKFGNSRIEPYKNFNFEVNDIQFTNATTCYICGYGAVLKSTDAGKTFSFLDAQNDYFKALHFKNEQTGIVIGYEGSILKTNDAGNTWTTIRNANTIFQKKLRFLGIATKNNSWMIVGEKGLLFYSTNNGDSWNELQKFTEHDLRGVHFIDEKNAIVVGNYGSLYEIKL